MAFDEVKRILIVFGMILVVASYLVFSNLDKLLRVLTTSNLTGQVLKLGWSG